MVMIKKCIQLILSILIEHNKGTRVSASDSKHARTNKRIRYKIMILAHLDLKSR